MAGVFVVSGPAGVGKGTVVAGLMARHPEVFHSVSLTTRARRPMEVDGVHYHFVDESRFAELKDNDGLLEWAYVHGAAYYGTPREPVEEALAAGRNVLLEIEIQGARQVRQTMPEATSVFIAPPSWAELVRRLELRGTETPEQVQRRLQTAHEELAAQSEFDHTVVNDEIGDAVDELVGLMGL
ncbi:guanylate kinase [Mariniluteicoccus endophyticus]